VLALYLAERSSFLVKLLSFHYQKTTLGLRLQRFGSDLSFLLSLISTLSSTSEQTDELYFPAGCTKPSRKK